MMNVMNISTCVDSNNSVSFGRSNIRYAIEEAEKRIPQVQKNAHKKARKLKPKTKLNPQKVRTALEKTTAALGISGMVAVQEQKKKKATPTKANVTRKTSENDKYTKEFMNTFASVRNNHIRNTVKDRAWLEDDEEAKNIAIMEMDKILHSVNQTNIRVANLLLPNLRCGDARYFAQSLLGLTDSDKQISKPIETEISKEEAKKLSLFELNDKYLSNDICIHSIKNKNWLENREFYNYTQIDYSKKQNPEIIYRDILSAKHIALLSPMAIWTSEGVETRTMILGNDGIACSPVICSNSESTLIYEINKFEELYKNSKWENFSEMVRMP